MDIKVLEKIPIPIIEGEDILEKILYYAIAISIIVVIFGVVIYPNKPKNRVRFLRVNRFTNKIVMKPRIKDIIRYYKLDSSSERITLFEEDCNKLFENLDKNKIYKTNSHSLILRKIKKGEGINILVEETKKKSLYVEKLLIGNTKNLFKKYRFYKIHFIIKDKK